MAPTPFEHGLALAWSDGALSRDGAIMLENLQEQLGITDSERAEQEQRKDRWSPGRDQRESRERSERKLAQ